MGSGTRPTQKQLLKKKKKKSGPQQQQNNTQQHKCIKNSREPAMVGTPTTDEALAKVDTPGTEKGMSTTAGSQQQQKHHTTA